LLLLFDFSYLRGYVLLSLHIPLFSRLHALLSLVNFGRVRIAICGLISSFAYLPVSWTVFCGMLFLLAKEFQPGASVWLA
jgi:hypothetical protein